MEDHVNEGNYGELFSKVLLNRGQRRDSDRFWYENKDAGFNKDDEEPKELADNDQILTILDSKTKVENGIT
ncbi:5284_t:CDS:2 [Funneliformis caledonium]|uniref:5284_t:CDS:1 n=1 Tax=Funneliformis caledonium TaxID=1117310 RepID=A0A9N9BWN3_9GLOM|nr:5284_t:CDS:2 [Funneliformis caledonium]